MEESERNLRLMQLLIKLNEEKDFETIELLGTMVEKDTESMKMSFEVMTKNSPLASFMGVEKLADAFEKKEEVQESTKEKE